VVDGAALEMLCRATYRGFESHLLRIYQISSRLMAVWSLFVFGETRQGEGYFGVTKISPLDPNTTLY
jgi:hypothetical protein